MDYDFFDHQAQYVYLTQNIYLYVKYTYDYSIKYMFMGVIRSLVYIRISTMAYDFVCILLLSIMYLWIEEYFGYNLGIVPILLSS